MYYHDNRLQYEVRVDEPNPVFAKMLQQAIGGVEGEIRVCLQYFFQAWGSRGPAKYRDMLLETATEEISHIEMLATAVAMNLEDAPLEMKEEMAEDKAVGAVMGGMDPRHVLSSGLGAMPVNSNGVPFASSNVYSSGNLAADMSANVTAESTGRTLVTRLYNMTEDKGMKDMLGFLVARDTMHQNQWLAVLEEIGGPEVHPIPNSFPQEKENQDYNYNFMSTLRDGEQATPEGRWTHGPSVDGKGEFSVFRMDEPAGQVPNLGMARPKSGAQKEQMADGASGMMKKAKDKAKDKMS